MTGEYNIKVKPLTPIQNPTWRNAKTLLAEMTLEVDGKQRRYSGTLHR